jgi:hypothetical protein
MPLSVIYLEKLSIGLLAVWLFYQLVLRRLTFYSWNRWYLLGYAALAFFLPVVNISGVVEGRHSVTTELLSYIPVIGDPRHTKIPAPATPGYFFGLSSWELMLAILALGSAILLTRLLVRWISLSGLRRRSTLIGDMGNAVKIYQVEGKIVPFSFGNAIYVNRRQHSEKEWEEIVLHEYVHIRQRHSIDILLAELLCILNWYNPFAWLIRHSIRQNLEFIADNKVLENGHDKKGYQYHLLQVIGESRYRLANNFNFSSLKKRIIMMNKIKSTRLHLVKFLFVLPLLMVLLVAFRSHYEAGRANAAPSSRKMANATSLTNPAPFTNAAPLASLAPSAAPASDSMPPGADTRKQVPTRPAPMGLQPVMPRSPDSLHPTLYFVDGVESVGGRNPLDKINPKDIDHIDVWGSDSARKAYGEKGKSRAVFIYMKPGRAAAIPGNPAAVGKDSTMTAYADRHIVAISFDTVGAVKPSLRMTAQTAIVGQPGKGSLRAADSYRGLILLDGNEISKQALDSLDASKIKSYNIYSGDVAVKEYGDKARNGVIVVVSK